MHGVKRVRHAKEVLEVKKLREQEKLKEYMNLSGEVLSRKKNRDWSQEAFQLTTQILQLNPEFYTVWNYRRNILVNGIFLQNQPQAIYNLLADELSRTTTALKAHPKVYWIWNHRRWCLENIPINPTDDVTLQSEWKRMTWERELFVVERLLEADARNFHAWDYRRYVLLSMPNPRPETNEIAYTTKKIESNFSNFSAWHQRSKVFASLWEKGELDEAKCKEEEFNLVLNAMYTDPNDQSVWMYHRWLVGSHADKDILKREIMAIGELLEQEAENKWCIESIAHYKLMLMKDSDEITRAELSKECLSLLEQLQNLDPCRYQRYAALIRRLP